MLKIINNDKIYPFLEKLSSSYNLNEEELIRLWNNLSELQVQSPATFYNNVTKNKNKKKTWKELSSSQKRSYMKKNLKDIQEKLNDTSNEYNKVYEHLQMKYEKKNFEEMLLLIKKRYSSYDSLPRTKDDCIKIIMKQDFDF